MIRNVLYKGTYNSPWKPISVVGFIIALFTGGVYRKLFSEVPVLSEEIPGIVLSIVIQFLFLLWAFRFQQRAVIVNNDAIYIRTLFTDTTIPLEQIVQMNKMYTYASNNGFAIYKISYEIVTDNDEISFPITEDEEFESMLADMTQLEWNTRKIDSSFASSDQMALSYLAYLNETVQKIVKRRSFFRRGN